MHTGHAGDIILGKAPCTNMIHAQAIIKTYRVQHPEFSKKVIYEIEDRDEQGNLLRRVFG